MGENFTNMDEAFRNAFQHAEAPYSPSEMQADWSQLASKIPHAPVNQAPVAQQALQHAGSSLGKILGFSGLGAAAVTTAVILYNVYMKPAPVVPVSKVEQTEVHTGTQAQPGAADQAGTKNNVSANNNTMHMPKGPLVSNSPLVTPNADSKKPVVPENPFGGTGSTNTDNPQVNNINPSSHTVKPSVKDTRTVSFYVDSLVCLGQAAAAKASDYSGTLSIDWGDGVKENFNTGMAHSYARPARYQVRISGYNNSQTEKTVSVVDKPKSRFSVQHPEKLVCSFANRSAQASKYVWSYGDGSADEYGYNAVHTFPDTGKYLVRLVSFNSGGCADTFTQWVALKDFQDPQLSSNVITPNGDHYNDDVYVNIQDETSFELVIFDRTGNPVFRSKDKNVHWDGKNMFNGSDCLPGTYYYSLTYSFRNNSEPHVKNGALTLIR